ncbi:HlyD family efflux transporter periplasmic adaptor subunit [Nemorincola caseinilytica]|uniref:HlyD family efflux transporter periplasmic adaptor subunit n=1 Tax=Nemorincola caseinilytica TaxID=2054315 RepID=A0ABP8NJF7_9BACT
MTKGIKITTIFLSIMLFAACKNEEKSFDASGAFEAEETIVSAQATGNINELNIQEGQALRAGDIIGYIDTVQLYLKKKQLETQITALLKRKPDVSVQLAALETQLATTERERARTINLLKGDAATPKQLDDINANIAVIKRQIEAQRSSLSISNESFNSDTRPLAVQIEQINDQLSKSRIINPINGTVLSKYMQAHEMASPGKAIYKIADLSTIILRAYISGNQLPNVKLNQKVKVNTDNGSGGYKEREGTIIWINDKAEFTPKTIQTKDERANMVYAIKVKIANDGSYKTGMYGELKF